MVAGRSPDVYVRRILRRMGMNKILICWHYHSSSLDRPATSSYYEFVGLHDIFLVYIHWGVLSPLRLNYNLRQYYNAVYASSWGCRIMRPYLGPPARQSVTWTTRPLRCQDGIYKIDIIIVKTHFVFFSSPAIGKNRIGNVSPVASELISSHSFCSASGGLGLREHMHFSVCVVVDSSH